MPHTKTSLLEAPTMKDFVLVVSIFALACLAANTASEQTDADRPASTSTVHGAIGDYVAAGLGISTPKSTSTLTTTTTSSFSSQSLTFPNNTATLTRLGTSDNVSSTVHGITTTSATDCWHSWLDYWVASRANTPEWDVTWDATTTVTESWTAFSYTTWTTTSWESTLYTFTFFKGSTIYSEDYPVSVSVSTIIESGSVIGWRTWTQQSVLGSYYTPVTLSYGPDRSILVASTTALPTPSCELPAIMDECSMAWSAKIFDHWHEASPDCTQAMITGDWCTALRSQYLEIPKFISAGHNVGWVYTGDTSYFPASKPLAPGCTLGCQACSITGESVQLYYWPPTTATLGENGTGTASLTPFTQTEVSMRTVSIDGTVLTSPTVYISYNVLHAADSCGAVGKTYRNTILPLSNTNHLLSVERLDPHGTGIRGTFATSSFNLMDLIEPVPDEIYNRQFRCKTSLQDWYRSSETGNATFSCARTESYAPVIEVPPEARALDPAWSSCRAWYGGLFDPPKALKPADASAVPTPIYPTTAKSSAATPKTTSELPTKTFALVTSSSGPQAEKGKNSADPIPAAPKSKAEEATGVPASTSGDASRVGKSKETQLDSSQGVAAILSILLTNGVQGTDAGGAPQATPASDPESFDGISVVTSAGSGAYTSLASQGRFAVHETLLADGQTTVVDGQTLSAMSGATMANDPPKPHSVLTQIPTPLVVFTVAGQAHTAVELADGNLHNDEESLKLYSASTLPHQSDAVLLAGHTLSQDGTPVTLDGQSITYDPNGISVSEIAASTTAMTRTDLVASMFMIDGTVYAATPVPESTGVIASQGHTSSTTTDHMAIIFTIDGTAYKATPIPESTGEVVWEGHTLSTSGSGVTVGDRLVTKVAESFSTVAAGGISSSLNDAESASQKWTTDVVQSYSSSVQQSSAAPSEPDESSASEHGLGFGLVLLGISVPLGTLVML